MKLDLPTFLQRYNDGQRESVWRELVELGESVRDDGVFSDAMAVACETMQRARRNVETLVGRLQQIGFLLGKFPDGTKWFDFPPLQPPVADVHSRVRELENLTGPIPLSLQAWWTEVGEIDLRGSAPLPRSPISVFIARLFGRSTPPPSEIYPWPAYSDPFIAWPIEAAEEAYREWVETCECDGIEEAGPFCVPIAPDYYHKDEVSGGGPYEIQLPNPAADAPLIGEWHNTTFVEYLRISFRWGGFPGLERHDKFPEELKTLFGDLLPL